MMAKAFPLVVVLAQATHQARSRAARSECDCVVPAKAGSQCLSRKRRWVPAFAGTTALSVLLAVLPAHAVELPKRKSGSWEISTSQAGGPPGPVAQMCIDATTDDFARQLAAGTLECSKQDLRREGDRYVADSVCKIGDSVATSRIVITGSFDTAYTADIDAKYSPPLMGMSEGRSTVSARWLGPCKPGQRAGDVTMPSGVVINVQDPPPGPRKN